jgi:transposase-like protein
MRREKQSDRQRGLVRELIELYDVKSVSDIQEALKDLLGKTLQNMLEAELDVHLGYEKGEITPQPKDNYRNGYKAKTLKTSEGKLEISVPHDRASEFEPKIIPKYSRDISRVEEKIISMFGSGMSTRDISEQIEEMYGFEVSAELVSRVTDKLYPQIEEWQNRPLSGVYPIVFIDGIVFHVRREKVVEKSSAYVVLGVNSEGRKEILSIEIGETESAKYWLTVFNALKNRGVKDILIICADGLPGIGEAIEASFPQTEYQRCIVHMIRNTLQFVSYKDRKGFANDLKSIYQASDEASGYTNMQSVR